MTPERYQTVKRIFQAALEADAADRARVIDEACAEDDGLRAEVVSMLAHYDTGFLEPTAIIESSSGLGPGEIIGRFEIIGRIGQGGMGEVFLARDPELGRNVAVKLLLPEFVSDAERVKRFKLEARSASALNHPNILTIHEIGEDQGKFFIATEFVRGETLRQMIKAGRTIGGAAIEIAEQIASALEAAHAAGIVHRDIKPENVMVRTDGLVKVLDFGLAKPLVVDHEAETGDFVNTRKGVIMGSVAYMSPEQARGIAVDTRTDIWSLGVVICEMLEGETPFRGGTTADVLANIIHKEPVLPESAPDLRAIISKCLNKEPGDRFGDGGEVRAALGLIARESGEAASLASGRRVSAIATPKENQKTHVMSDAATTEASVEIARVRSRYRRGIILTLGILAMTTAAVTVWKYLLPKKLAETAFRNAVVEKLAVTGDVYSVAISPDSRYLAFVEGVRGVRGRIILRQMETGSQKEVVPPSDGQIFINSFSADGSYIYYYYLNNSGDYLLRRVPILGGNQLDIAIYPDSTISFSSDGRKMVFEHATDEFKKHHIYVADSDGKNEKTVYSSDKYYLWAPKLSPDGTKILVIYGDLGAQLGRKARFGWLPADGGELTPVGDTTWDFGGDANTIGYHPWLSDGSGFLVSHRALSEQTRQLKLVTFPSGEVTSLTRDESNYLFASVNQNAEKLVQQRETTSSGIWDFDLESGAIRQVRATSTQTAGHMGLVAMNETKLILTKPDGRGNNDLWIRDLGALSETLFVAGKGAIENPIVSQAGPVYFTANNRVISDSEAENAIWRTDSDGKNPTKMLGPTDSTMDLLCAGEDGKSLFTLEFRGDRNEAQIFRSDLATGAKDLVFGGKGIELLNSSNFSPGCTDVVLGYVNTPDKSKEKRPMITELIEIERGFKPRTKLVFPSEARFWDIQISPDKRSAYYRDRSDQRNIWRFDFATRKSKQITDFALDQIFKFAVSPNGKKLYIVRGNTTTDLVIIRNAV